MQPSLAEAGAGGTNSLQPSQAVASPRGSTMFKCPVCLEATSRDEVFVPTGCKHELCRGCARGVVLNAVR